MSMASSGVDPLGKSQVGVGGFGNGGSSAGGAAGGVGLAGGSGGSMAVHSRGDEAFMDGSASAALDAHRVWVSLCCLDAVDWLC
jgi:hypothetical protein